MNLQNVLPQRLVGLDVQQDAIRLVKASRRGRKTRIEQVGSIAVSQTIFNEERIEDWQQLHDAVSELVITTGLRHIAVSICLPATLVETGTISMPPRLSSTAMKQAISAQLGGNKVWQIDYRVEAQTNKNELSITYVATEKAYLLQYIGCLESCGLKVKHVDIDSYALKRFANCHLSHDIDVSYMLRQQLAEREENYYSLAIGLAIYGCDDGV